MCAQLRDMFAAEDSTVVAQKDESSRRVGPEGPEPDGVPVNVRQ
jgi:hypothetical protein